VSLALIEKVNKNKFFRRASWYVGTIRSSAAQSLMHSFFICCALTRRWNLRHCDGRGFCRDSLSCASDICSFNSKRTLYDEVNRLFMLHWFVVRRRRYAQFHSCGPWWRYHSCTLFNVLQVTYICLKRCQKRSPEEPPRGDTWPVRRRCLIQWKTVFISLLECFQWLLICLISIIISYSTFHLMRVKNCIYLNDILYFSFIYCNKEKGYKLKRWWTCLTFLSKSWMLKVWIIENIEFDN